MRRAASVMKTYILRRRGCNARDVLWGVGGPVPMLNPPLPPGCAEVDPNWKAGAALELGGCPN